MIRGSIELARSRPACHLCRAGAVTRESERIDEIAKKHALIRRTQVIVEPGENNQDHRLLGTTEVLRSKAYGRNGCQQEAACLQRCEPFGGERAPWFVDEVFLDGIWGTLIGNVEDEQVQPNPEEDKRETEEDGRKSRILIGGEEGTGQGTEDPEGGFGVYHGDESLRVKSQMVVRWKDSEDLPVS